MSEQSDRCKGPLIEIDHYGERVVGCIVKAAGEQLSAAIAAALGGNVRVPGNNERERFPIFRVKIADAF